MAWANPNELYLSTENPNPASPHLHFAIYRLNDEALSGSMRDFFGQLARDQRSRVSSLSPKAS